jgi:hypothetical protein
MARKSARKAKQTDSNLALIAIILGATSFFMSVLTGIPAIILGIIALYKNAGDRLQAKLAILFGVLSTALTVFLIWLVGFHLFHSPLSQQWSVPSADYTRMRDTTKALNKYRKTYGNYPSCSVVDTASTCADWEQFVSNNPGLIKNPVVFETDATQVQTQPAGTIVYVTKATCILNTPTLPAYVRDHNDPTSGPSDNNAAIVYFYAKGRACFSTDQN